MPEANVRHRPAVAMALSLLFAGLGQLYNRRYVKGILFIIIEAAFLMTFYNFLNIGLWGLVTLGEIPMLDHSSFSLDSRIGFGHHHRFCGRVAHCEHH